MGNNLTPELLSELEAAMGVETLALPEDGSVVVAGGSSVRYTPNGQSTMGRRGPWVEYRGLQLSPLMAERLAMHELRCALAVLVAVRCHDQAELEEAAARG